MTTPSKPEGFSTTDLTLAAFLIHEGFSAEKFEKERLKSGYPIGGWEFNDDTKRVHEKIVEYNGEKARVDPKTFHMTMSRVRSEMYDFLGIKKGKS